MRKHHHDFIASDDSPTLKPLDERHRSLDRDLDSVSPPSTSQSRALGIPSLAGESVSGYSLDTTPRRKNRRWISKNLRDRGQLSQNPDVAALEADVASLRIDERVGEKSEVCERFGEQSESSERVDEQCDISKRVWVEFEFEAETSKDLKRNEFDAVERIEELGFGVEETELSEELIRTNSQAQEDELLAMEYIYPDSVKKLERQRGLQCFEVHINIEIPHGIIVSTKLDSSSDDKTTGNKSMEDFSYSFQVQYLPPMVLTCLLPNSYPSHQPPYFTLSVQWLDPKSASGLCSMLDSIWMERSGQEIIYHWVEWLSSSSLSYLGFEKEIIICPFENKHIEDRHAVFVSVSPDVVIPLIKRYNGERLYKNFQLISHECCICFSEYPGSEFARLPCQHFFCLKCMKTFCDMHVTEGTVIKLQCPEAKCGGSVPPSLLKRILSQEEYERWESLTLQKSLDSMVDVAYCPRCETPCIEEEDQHAQCTSCFFSFCTLCRDRRHVGTECLSPELKIKILQDRQNSSQLKEGQRRKEKEMIEELKSITAILTDAKQCPSCNMAISKIEGCNKMVCNNCGRFFCYRCNKAIDGYDHYRNGACELFPREMIEEWEEQQMNQREVDGQAHADPFAEQERGLNCLTCGQFNAKVGNNNHLFCWACHLHYCYLCKKVVRRSAQHYGPKTCRQHTDD